MTGTRGEHWGYSVNGTPAQLEQIERARRYGEKPFGDEPVVRVPESAEGGAEK